jgi:hypothetical protein
MITPFTDEIHQRYYVNGKRVVGASTVSKINAPCQPLMEWAHEMGMNNKDMNKERDRTADVGTIAHSILQAHILNDEIDFIGYSSPTIRLGQEIGDRLTTHWDESGLEVISVEESLTSKLGYGGTLDVLCRVMSSKRLRLVDIKTCTGIYRSHASQLSGYGHLWDENKEEKIDEFEIWHFNREGSQKIYKFSREKMDLYFAYFQTQLALYKAEKLLPKYV